MSFSSNFAINKCNKKTERIDKMYCCLGVFFIVALWSTVIFYSVSLL